jgi:tRNA-specific 2-thiouridylase
MIKSKKPIVAVAMSGGVDSSVTAALLVERGFSVFGIMLRLWSESEDLSSNRCCNPDSVAFARRVASTLSIPFYVLDARQFFYDNVIIPFIDDYTHNKTPNPCINCNRIIRWQFLLNHALSAGADSLATGHYARIATNPDGSLSLLKGLDASKDQSYVLHMLTQKQLNLTKLPLGEYTKTEVRQLAHRYNLPVAERPDSQDLCFVGADGNYRHFLKQHAPGVQNTGEIVDQQGNVLGQHDGLAFYTIGQRKGLHISSRIPLYVLEKDSSRNQLIVGSQDQAGADQLTVENVNWIAGEQPASSFTTQVKIRYKAQELPAEVQCLPGNSIQIRFVKSIHDATPGQAAVLYNGEVCIGGGIISNVARSN